MPMCMTGPVPSTPVPGFGGAPLATIQDSPGMDLDIDPGTPILIPIMATPQAGHPPIPVGQASVLRLQRMHRHECSGDRTR
jgi:hypothetical protein